MIVIWFSNFIACTVVPKLHHNNQIPFEMTKKIGIGTIFMVCIDSDKLELVLFCCRLHEYSRHSIQVCTVSGQSAYQRNQQWTNSNYYFPNVSQMSNLYASRLSLFSQCRLLDVLTSIIIYMTNKRKPSWIESCNCWQSFRVCNFRLQWFHDREHVFYMWSDLIESESWNCSENGQCTIQKFISRPHWEFYKMLLISKNLHFSEVLPFLTDSNTSQCCFF